MLGKHINKKQQYKFVVIGILILISLLALMSNVILNTSSSIAQNNSNVSVVYSANPNADADMYYGTKAYWDDPKNYGPHESKYLDSLDPGQVLGKDGQTTDYFIRFDLVGGGDLSFSVDPAAIVIRGTVNLYFEAEDASDLTGPYLYARGAKGITSGYTNLGSGAGIEITDGATLRIYGRGTIDVASGDVNWDQALQVSQPIDGGKPSTDSKEPYSGYGGYGGNGSGGTGAAIGSNGGNGGLGGQSAAGRTGFDEQNGSKGNNGGDGSGTNAVGDIKISGNITLITEVGTITGFDIGKRDYKHSGERVVQGKSATLRYTFNSGGGGAWGGLGWYGALIGSGGAGGGGGGSGGGGSIVYEGWSGDYCKGTGGGGGGGASSSYKAGTPGLSGDFPSSDYKNQGTDGEMGPWDATSGGNIYGKGGTGASGPDESDCGDGGNGGKGGISGNCGFFYGPLLPKSEHFSYGEFWSQGREANRIKCYPTSELNISNSIVDWCLAQYFYDDSNDDDIELCHFPSGNLVDESFYSSSYVGTRQPGDNDVVIEPAQDEYSNWCITKDDLVSKPDIDELTYNLWLVRQGIVDISLNNNEMVFNGRAVNIRDFLSAKYGDAEVISNIPTEEIITEWWKVDGSTETKLEGSPVDAGNYKVKYYVKGLDYISRIQETDEFTILQRESLKLKPKDISLKTGSLLPEKSTIEIVTEGLAEYDTLVYDEDYSINYEKQAEDKYNIVVTAKDSLKRNYKNINIEVGIILYRDHSAKATAIDASKIYGEADPVFSATFSDWDDPEHPTPILNKDYFVSRMYGEDVDTYAIKVTINYENDSVFKDYAVECIDATFTINKTDANIKAKDASKQYGDEDPAFGVELSGFKFGNVPVLREDYEFNVKPTAQYDVYSIDVVIIGDGPLSNNYNLSGTSGTLTITKRDATITPDSKYVVVGQEDVPLTITTENMLPEDALVAGTDYTISREPGFSIGKYTISVVIIEPRTAKTRNYNFTINEGTYEIFNGFVTVSAVSTSTLYNGKDLDQDDLKKISLHTDSEALKPQDFIYGRDYMLTKEEGKDVGTYTIYVHILNTCEYLQTYKLFTESSTVTISPVNASITINDVPDVNYGEEEHGLSINKVEGLVSGEELTLDDYELIRDPGTNVGSYDIDAIINSEGDIAKNYSFVVNKGKYTINKIDAYLETIGTDDDNTVIEKVYGQNDPDIPAHSYCKDAEGNEVPLPYGDEFIYNWEYLSSRTDGEDVGEYPITITMSSGSLVTYNYNVHITSDKPLRILPFSFSDAIVNTVEAVEYTGQPLCPDIYAYYDFVPNELNASANRKVFENGKDFTIVYENNIEVGTATATLTPDGENVVGEPRVVEFEILPHIEPDPGNITPAVSTGDYNYLLIFGILVVFVLCSIVLLRKYNK